MIRFIILLTISLATLTSQAQQWERAMFFGGTDNELVTGMGVVPGGKVAIAGKFADSIIMKNGTYYGQLPSPANDNYFVALLDSNGNEIWMKTFSKNSTNLVGIIGSGLSSMLTDKSGNIYVNVNFTSTATSTVYFNGGVNYNMPTKSALLKFDSNGNLLWYRSYTGGIRCMSINSSDNIHFATFVQGNFNSITINDYNLNYTGLIDPDFLIELDQNGNTVNTKVLNNQCGVTSIVDDSLGNYYVQGSVANASGLIDFIDATPDIATGQANSLFWMKFNSSGNLKWAKYVAWNTIAGNMAFASVNKGGTLLSNIGFLKGSGFTYGSTVFNPNNKNLLIHALMDSSGNFVATPSAEISRTVLNNFQSVFNDGYYYVTGLYSPKAIFGDTIIADGGNNTSDGYVVKYNTDGEQVWFRAATGINNQNLRYIQVAGDYVYLAANLNADAIVGNIGASTDIGWNYYDIFFSRLHDCNATLTKQGLALQANAGLSYKWFKDGAVESSVTTQNYNPVYNGRYQVEVTFAGGCKCKTASVQFSSGITGIQNGVVKEGIQMFPNPAVQNATIQAPIEAGVLNVTLIDNTGRTVWKAAMGGSGEIPLSGISPGLYTVTVHSERGFWQEKLVVE